MVLDFLSPRMNPRRRTNSVSTRAALPFRRLPGRAFRFPGKNREGYWGFAESEEQVTDVMDCFEVLELNEQITIEVDPSTGHAKYLPKGLHVFGEYKREVRRETKGASQ